MVCMIYRWTDGQYCDCENFNICHFGFVSVEANYAMYSLSGMDGCGFHVGLRVWIEKTRCY